MQPLKDLMPKPSPQLVSNSVTTTPPRAPSARIGEHPGGRGLATTSATTALAAGRAPDPTAMHRGLLAQLPPGIRSSLKPVYDAKGELTNYRLTHAHPTELTSAKQVLASSLMPMTGEKCLDLLTEMKAMTRPSPGTTADIEAQMVAYLKRLMDYPADVVNYVLTTQPDYSPWWPAWAELKERLEMHTYRRRMMMTALTSPRA